MPETTPERPDYPKAIEDAIDPYSADIRAKVAEFGWAAIAVDSQPPFSYTVGLRDLFNHPEMIVTGLPEETSKWVLDRAVAEVQAGRPLLPDTTIPGLMGELAAAVREVDRSHLTELAMAADYYGGLDYAAVQLIWPDRSGRFHWDRGVAKDFTVAQPLLAARRSRLGRLLSR